MTCFCTASALSQPQLLRGQTAQAPNPVGFPGTWPLPGPLPPMATRDLLQPGSTSLAETARLLPLLPVRPPGLSPLSAPPPAPRVSFPAAHPPRGPGAPCSGISPVAGILAPHPGQSSFHGLCLLGHCLPLLPFPLPPPGVSFLSPDELGPLMSENVS